MMSLRNKVDDLKLLLANLHLKFAVVGISEFCLQNDARDVDMIGYEFSIHKNRPDRSGEVVGLSLSNNFDIKCMTTSLVPTKVSWNHCFILKSLGQTRKILLLKLPE